MLDFVVTGMFQTIALLQPHHVPFHYIILKYLEIMIECKIQNEGCHFNANKILSVFLLSASSVDILICFDLIKSASADSNCLGIQKVFNLQ